MSKTVPFLVNLESLEMKSITMLEKGEQEDGTISWKVVGNLQSILQDM